ncbi:hypothetical protein H4O20_00800 [Aequorivita sp. 609]|uniref:hypothetical protein n=1 Tax=Aequorivita TaxID=153265 RepID=UPI00160AEDA8|nr:MULTISPECIES: hypothetical protein [Aequorivita]MBB6679980.1 hypothetical protein [Aequorivita sp. 609]
MTLQATSHKPQATSHKPQALKALILLLFLFYSIFLFAQNKQDYYVAQDAGSAYLMITSTSNGTSNNYIIDTTNSITIDVSSYTSGTYNIALVCDDQIQDSKNLLKQ